jgi:hypothetical protein
MTAMQDRVALLDWPRIRHDLDQAGGAVAGRVLAAAECAALAALFAEAAPFRSRVVMARHGFGRGEYGYFAYPLPEPLAALRAAFYAGLAPLANEWAARLGTGAHYPPEHAAFLERCHAAGQARPTPLLLRYGPGDHNCLHQDLYGEHVFPLQVVVLLSEPGRDFTGGEFVLTEQRPRRQTRAEVLAPLQGEAVVFASHRRPVTGARGSYAATLRHGVSRVRSGLRFTAGLVFHDAA